MVQVLPRDALEDDAEGRNLQVVAEAVVELVPIDCGLEHQQPQHHQVVLKHTFSISGASPPATAAHHCDIIMVLRGSSKCRTEIDFFCLGLLRIKPPFMILTPG